MDLTPHVDRLRQELVLAAEARGEDARDLAERLAAPLESAVRLTLLDALSAAMSEVTRELAPGSVDVRLRGLAPEFVVTPPPRDRPYENAPAAPTPAATTATTATTAAMDDDGSVARVNFRLPGHLKSRVESAASREGLSVNAWLVRAAAVALEPGGAAPAHRADADGLTWWAR
ncbi:hypothetical protein [Streptomyces sp. NPDC050504]|uniref:hypothetical protein n=1 Tax=Streptomyces sp. NPDC050504 TaxID=3365618 RepID=UPI0037A1283D